VFFGMMLGIATGTQSAAIQGVQMGSFLLSLLLSGYLFAIANNVLVSRHRYESVRVFARQSPLTDALQPAEDLTPERVLIGKQEYQRMIAALQNLPPRAREAFIFHRFEEMSHPAIARRMGISVIAVRKLISRAMERIAEIMEGRQ